MKIWKRKLKYVEFLLYQPELIVMTITVEQYMTKKPYVLKLPSSVSEAMKIMAKRDVAAVPVTNSKGEYAGIVTRRDILEHPKEDEISLLMRKDLPTLGPKDSIEKAAELFIKIRRRHLPIVEENKIVGILTPYDLLDAVIAKKPQRTIRDVMKSQAIPVYDKATARMVEKVIRLTKVTAFPVLDDDGKLVGIVTERDLLGGANLDVKTVSSQLGIGEDDDSWSWESLRDIYTFYYTVRDLELPNVKIKEIMSKNPQTIFEGSPVTEAAKIMKKNKFTQLPVTDIENEISGMVYDFDVISSLI